MRGNVSGWYARLDRECEDRIEQMNIWLNAWEQALRTHQPQASQLPSDWPTLPASLLTDPGHVLDHLLCRHDAESDGRSPRGAHPTPTRLADAIIADELKSDTVMGGAAPELSNVNLAALPPAFRAQAEAINDEKEAAREAEVDEETEQEIAAGARTRTGVPLPFADPAVGGGLFPSRILKWHGEKISDVPLEERAQDTRTLLSSMQLLDVCEVAAEMTRRRLLLSAIRADLVRLDDEPVEGYLTRSEAEKIFSDVVRVGDALRDDWPWDESPRILMGNPPWLRIKDRFRGHPDGSSLRKELGEELNPARRQEVGTLLNARRRDLHLGVVLTGVMHGKEVFFIQMEDHK